MKLVTVAALLIAIGACGEASDDASGTENQLPADNIEDVGEPGEADPDEDLSDALYSSGHVLIQDDRYELVPRQCDSSPDGGIHISGTAESDPEVRIVYDVSDPGDEPQLGMELPPDYFESPWLSESVTPEVDGETIRGSAMMIQSGTGEQALAEFEFVCS